MAARSQYEELARQLRCMAAMQRGLARLLPHDCPAGPTAVLALLKHHGEMRMNRLAELLGVDMSVASRHVTHVAERGWVERKPDPTDRRSRLLRLTGEGEQVLRMISRRYVDTLSTALSGWPDEEVGLLVSLLARMQADVGRRLPAD
ncbi:MarR family transcriptional regulator [Streptomyces sp. ACA25]|uniref:MarR family winged helix-turn-helix transcriptional regulator n=1 Tax=Streptomyces sp. ACA25 TaxID=3022596 RepID=UPI0023083560|nr:MarR family transcriptional regulator [Streptomyces sp. ACA25]MDB1090199.1 MarR family transcriptional regulator [Streptomyces sp. ACA25]